VLGRQLWENHKLCKYLAIFLDYMCVFFIIAYAHFDRNCKRKVTMYAALTLMLVIHCKETCVASVQRRMWKMQIFLNLHQSFQSAHFAHLTICCYNHDWSSNSKPVKCCWAILLLLGSSASYSADTNIVVQKNLTTLNI